MLKYALLKVFTDHAVQSSYNPFLWPMSIELYGSFFVFGVLFSLRSIKRPGYVVATAALYLCAVGSFFSLFFVGLWFSLLRADGFFYRIRASRVSKFALLGLALIIFADALLERLKIDRPQLQILMSSAIVFVSYSNKNIVSFLSNRVSRYLGRVSFPLYVCQFAIIISYTSWLIVYFSERGVLDFECSLLVIISSIVLTFLVAEVF